MTMRDHANNITIRPVIAPGTYTDAGTTPWVGAIIDKAGYETLTYAIVTGTLSDANATYAVLLEESDASNMDGAAAVADADLIGTEAEAAFTYANDGVSRKLGYVGNKRYTRLTITPTGADSGNSPIAALAILGRPHAVPV
jgi:hypothetical protein